MLTMCLIFIGFYLDVLPLKAVAESSESVGDAPLTSQTNSLMVITNILVSAWNYSSILIKADGRLD